MELQERSAMAGSFQISNSAAAGTSLEDSKARDWRGGLIQ